MPLQFLPSDQVRSDVEGGILCVTINRPEKRNALSLGVLNRLREIFEAHRDDPSLRFAILTGAGEKAFASGGDLKELSSIRGLEETEAMSCHGRRALDAIRTFPVPVVARLNGSALGGGAELALACDVRIATASARLGFIHGRLAISTSWGGGTDLIRLVGASTAIWLCLHAAPLDMGQALGFGLVNASSATDAGFEETFRSFVDTMAARPPQVMRAIKALSIAERMAAREASAAAETTAFVEAWVHQDHWAAADAALGGGKG